MLYLLAFLVPPVAVLLCGKPIQAVVSVALTLLLWVPGMIHAMLVVADRNANKRTDRLIKAVRGQH